MKKTFFITALFMINIYVSGQDNMNTGIIYGENHSYSLTAPEGWILDNQSGINQGLYAVFYKKGETWASAETVMYTNTASFENTELHNIEDLIKYDIEHFKKEYGTKNISDGKDIRTKDGSIAKVKYFSGDVYGNFEAIAYIGTIKTGIMIVMSTKTKNGFEDSLNDFEELVQSFWFITEDVRIKKQ
jgi:hypothetical protein